MWLLSEVNTIRESLGMPKPLLHIISLLSLRSGQ